MLPVLRLRRVVLEDHALVLSLHLLLPAHLVVLRSHRMSCRIPTIAPLLLWIMVIVALVPFLLLATVVLTLEATIMAIIVLLLVGVVPRIGLIGLVSQDALPVGLILLRVVLLEVVVLDADGVVEAAYTFNLKVCIAKVFMGSRSRLLGFGFSNALSRGYNSLRGIFRVINFC